MHRAVDEDMAHWIADQLQADISKESTPGYGVLRFTRNGVDYQLQVERDPNAIAPEPVQRQGLPTEEHEPTSQELKTAIKALESLVSDVATQLDVVDQRLTLGQATTRESARQGHQRLQWRGDRFSTRLDALEKEAWPRTEVRLVPQRRPTLAELEAILNEPDEDARPAEAGPGWDEWRARTMKLNVEDLPLQPGGDTDLLTQRILEEEKQSPRGWEKAIADQVEPSGAFVEPPLTPEDEALGHRLRPTEADLPSQTALEALTRRIIKLESGKTDWDLHQERVQRALDTRLTELEWYHPELKREELRVPGAEFPGRTWEEIDQIRRDTLGRML